jgi:hypothetical protein
LGDHLLTVKNWEPGHTEPTIQHKARIAALLGTTRVPERPTPGRA